MSTKGIAVVTGSAQGIGRAIALRLADDGFNVALNDLSSQMEMLEILRDEISRKGQRSEIIVGDVSVEEDVKSLVSRVGIALGGLDVFSINSRGVFLCFRYAGEYMINQGRGGRMIAASSTVGKQGKDFAGVYSATKFAVRGMTQAFAKALGKHGITANVYAPGLIDTEMLRAIGKEASGSADKFYAEQRMVIPVGSIGTPDDIANVVSYLASKESRFITGQTILVNGGTSFD
ncbi:acetoin reductase family protein [Infundibulicybe gibba]|nr:acetoin reductase family protein [Infundibulicybe gibba]